MKSKLYYEMQKDYDPTIMLCKTTTKIVNLLKDILFDLDGNETEEIKQAINIIEYHKECYKLTQTHKMERHTDAK